MTVSEDKAAAEVTRQIQIGVAAVRWIILAAFVVIVAAVGLAVVVSNMGDDVQSIGGNVTSNTRTIEEVQEQVDHLEIFVDQLEEESPDETAQNEAISRAVALVPEIREILCEAFPEVSQCQLDNTGG